MGALPPKKRATVSEGSVSDEASSPLGGSGVGRSGVSPVGSSLSSPHSVLQGGASEEQSSPLSVSPGTRQKLSKRIKRSVHQVVGFL